MNQAPDWSLKPICHNFGGKFYGGIQEGYWLIICHTLRAIIFWNQDNIRVIDALQTYFFIEKTITQPIKIRSN
jgi:hypothetical protein